MRLSLLLRSPDPRFEDLFCFFYELAMQVYSIARDAIDRIVFAEDVVGGLFVVLVYFGSVLF
jgi:hypothetical protein